MRAECLSTGDDLWKDACLPKADSAWRVACQHKAATMDATARGDSWPACGRLRAATFRRVRRR